MEIKLILRDIYNVVKKTNVHTIKITIFKITKILKRLIVLILTHSLIPAFSHSLSIFTCNKTGKSLSFSLKNSLIKELSFKFRPIPRSYQALQHNYIKLVDLNMLVLSRDGNFSSILKIIFECCND